MGNSINNVIEEDDRVGSVILAIKGHSVDKKLVIVVEGNDDADFYSRFFENSTCDVIVNNSCRGYQQISETCNKKGYSKRYFLIKDADFDRLIGTPGVANQLLTDFHDCEMFLTAIDIDGILREKYKVNINAQNIATSISSLSFVKWYNKANNYQLRFKKKCTLPKIYDGCQDVTFNSCINQLKEDEKNHGLTVMTEEDLKAFSSEHDSSDWRQYTNGHDWLQAIAQWINVRQKTTLSYKLDIRPYLENFYTPETFKSTNLCNEIKRLEQTLGRRIIK